ncbi:MAG: short-chain dehydrogenase/reductase [Rhodospirillales bacterium]|nr:short-chain dehydrogenase/reductase [Rhodospirillales bacterium]
MAGTIGGRLEDRVAVVTGGGQGVGRGIVRRFAREGATILLAQRNAEQGEEVVAELRAEFGVKAVYLKTDVTVREQVDAMVAAAVAQFGAIDILVNNAGGSFPKRLENHTDADMAQGMDLNFWSTFWAMRTAFPHMKARQWGRIINLGSLNGVNAHMFTAQYNISKEAVRALTRTAAVEWGPHGITSNVICPAVNSPAGDIYYAANPEMLEAIKLQIPRGKLGEAEADVGGVAAFLASDDAAHVNGTTQFVDGGSHVNGVVWRPEVED